MADNNGAAKKSNEKKPTTFRIDPETAEKLREICQDFPNQDLALNAIIAAYERESIMSSLPQFAEDVTQFEQYKQGLSVKFMDLLNALASADVRAKAEVQQLLDSKDAIIQDYQKRIDTAQQDRATYENLFHSASKEKEELEANLEKEKLACQGLRSEMKEKESQYNSSLQDKIQINEILTQTIAQKQEELDQYKEYGTLLKDKDDEILSLSAQLRQLENKLKEEEYAHRLALLEKERTTEAEKAELRVSHEEQMDALREKLDAEIAKLREKNDAAQSRIQELLNNK